MKETITVVELGCTWSFEVELEEVDGKRHLNGLDAHRINQSIALTIFEKSDVLSLDEYYFLAEVTGITQKQVAEILSCTSQAICNWKRRGKIPALESKVLKEYFFSDLFEEELHGRAKTIESRLKTGIDAVKVTVLKPKAA